MTRQSFVVVLVVLSVVGNLQLSQAQDLRCLSRPDTSCSSGLTTAWYFNNETKKCDEIAGCNVNTENSFNSSNYCEHACSSSSSSVAEAAITKHTYDTNQPKTGGEASNDAASSTPTATPASVFAAPDAAAAQSHTSKARSERNPVNSKKISNASKISSTTPPPLHLLVEKTRQKRSTSNRRHRQQHYKEQEEDDLMTDEEESSIQMKTRRTGRVDAKRRVPQTKNRSRTPMESATELDETRDYERMESRKKTEIRRTAEKNEKIAKSSMKTRKVLHEEDKIRNEDLELEKERTTQEEAEVEEKQKKSHERAVPKKHVPSTRSRPHSSERKIHGMSSASAAERKTADNKGHSRSSLTELLKTGEENELDNLNHGLPTIAVDVQEEDEEFEVVSEKIKNILVNPSYVFSYTNITGDDFVSLQEMVFQSDVGSMQLVEKSEADKLEAERKREALKNRDNNLRIPIKVLKTEEALNGKRSDDQTPAIDMKSAEVSA